MFTKSASKSNRKWSAAKQRTATKGHWTTAGSSYHCEMAAAYTQVTIGARLVYTFSGDVKPNVQGLLDRSKRRSEGHDVLSQTCFKNRSAVECKGSDEIE